MERRSGALLLAALLPLGLMCSAFSEQLLGDACDRYKEPAGGAGDLESSTSQRLSRGFHRLALFLGCNGVDNRASQIRRSEGTPWPSDVGSI